MVKLGVQTEFKYFICIILSGVFLGVIYDLFRAKRKVSKTDTILTNIEDVLFSIIFTIVFLAVTYYLNSGIVRLNGILGLLAGFFLYFYFTENKVVTFLVFSFFKIRSFFIIIFKIVFFPLKFIIHLFKKPVYIVFWFVNAKVNKNKNRMKTLLHKLKNELKIIRTVMLKKK